ncbi:serine--tRNA ligase [Tanacetum coccineum]
MLDINLFMEEKGYNPEIIRESQLRRFKPVEIIDEIILLDKEWRQRDASAMMQDADKNRDSIAAKDAEVQEAKTALFEKLDKVGNLVHASVPVSKDEENNAVVRTWGEKRVEPKLKNHVELVELLGIADAYIFIIKKFTQYMI